MSHHDDTPPVSFGVKLAAYATLGVVYFAIFMFIVWALTDIAQLALGVCGR